VPVLYERLWTRLPIERAFPFVADFANAALWDPGTATAVRIDEGPVGVGARYRLGVRMGNAVRAMEYRITAYEPPRRVVLAGTGSGVSATDEITFRSETDGTRIEYRADIRLTGLVALLTPFVGRQLATIARQAREGMQLALDRLARDGQGA
jgi:carbon monoxide dehydrogenase subunit G